MSEIIEIANGIYTASQDADASDYIETQAQEIDDLIQAIEFLKELGELDKTCGTLYKALELLYTA